MIDTNIPKIIKRARTAAGLSQKNLVALYNKTEPVDNRLDRPLLSRYETGRVMPKADKYIKLMAILNGEMD